MKIKLLRIWDSLHSSYWFVPALMVAMASGLAFLMLTLDRMGKSGPIEELGWVYTGGPEGARTLLSTVAGSMMTVAGTVFSITIVAMTLAASQFGPRLLRNFMQNTGNQIVIGTFVSTYIYCLLILRTIRGEDYDKFVPQLSVTVGAILALVSVGVLIYFIHHASTSIQASHIIADVGDELEKAIERIFPEKIPGDLSSHQQRYVAEISSNFGTEAVTIVALDNGYLQAIDEDKLMKIATTENLLIRLEYRQGHFVNKGSPLVRVWHGKQIVQRLTIPINQAFVLARQRTEQEDLEFCINQLVEIAVRAISPGINDPFTAIRCIDQLGAGLCQIAERDFPTPYCYDDRKNLRIIKIPITFVGLVNAAFNQIRQYGSSDVAVSIRLLEAIAEIASHTRYDQDRAILLRQAKLIQRACQEAIPEEEDLRDVRERYLRIVKQIH